MLVPGIIFCLINLFHGSLSYLKGFAIPMATDIAFALGILSLIKTRIPKSLLILLSAIAIVDDLGAILIIGIFYSHDLSLLFCLLSLLIFLILIGLNFFKIQRLELFLFFGLLLWGCLIKSGIHATLAGVLIALTIPTHKDHNLSLLHKLENKLLTPVSYFIIPLFVLFNAGISFQAESLNTADWMNLFQQYYPILLGILLGFLIGKPIGIFCTTWGLTRLNWVTLPQGLSLFHVFGVSLLAGIGFTMSIFISDLAFSPDIKILFFCKLGIFLASIISGAIGLLYLRFKSTASIYT